MLSTVNLQILTAVIAALAGLLVLKMAVTPKEFHFGRRALLVALGVVMMLLAVAWVYITVRMTSLVTSTFASLYLPVILLVLVAVVAVAALITLGRVKKNRAARREAKMAARDAEEE